MIGRLRGQLAKKGPDHLLIDVGGVGYLVTVSERVLMALPREGATISLYTELLVREDLLQLFGFLSEAEREWHRLLISVQGIGAKASMAILGALGPSGVSQAIALGDWHSIATAKGVGPKTAQRVTNELKDKAARIMSLHDIPSESFVEDDRAPQEEVTPQPARTARPIEAADQSNAPNQGEALSALTNLGYAPGEAAGAVATALREAPDTSTSTLIRAALRLLAPKDR